MIDQDWPRSETDYLFWVVRDYDQRWPIVHDRYDFPGSDRTMEVFYRFVSFDAFFNMS